jgi:hypothetical protein
MTPNDIEILIHCYVSPGRHPRYDSNRRVFQKFITDGLVVFKDEGIYQTTEKGAAHVHQLCSLPLPVKQFVGYDGKVIDLHN